MKDQAPEETHFISMPGAANNFICGRNGEYRATVRVEKVDCKDCLCAISEILAGQRTRQLKEQVRGAKKDG